MLTKSLIGLCERGLVPEALTRAGIRRLLRKRLAKEDLGSKTANQARALEMVARFSEGPIALVPEKANEQHYEVPAELYQWMLGPLKKYSSCYWPDGCETLEDAERFALAQTCEHAEIVNGQEILELGCGWGSLTLWMAEQFPDSRVTAVSNSASQREFIVRRAEDLGLAERVRVITCDMNDFSIGAKFDRVVSVEMFEHMRNYKQLLSSIASWLKDDGKLMVHVFCHRALTYEFNNEGEEDWMSRYFFSGGLMPAEDFLPRFDADLKLENQWKWSGVHYQKTCDAWLANMDHDEWARCLFPVFEEHYGKAEALVWFERWRMFHMACSELFGYDDGDQWYVTHYLFGK